MNVCHFVFMTQQRLEPIHGDVNPYIHYQCGAQDYNPLRETKSASLNVSLQNKHGKLSLIHKHTKRMYFYLIYFYFLLHSLIAKKQTNFWG